MLPVTVEYLQESELPPDAEGRPVPPQVDHRLDAFVYYVSDDLVQDPDTVFYCLINMLEDYHSRGINFEHV